MTPTLQRCFFALLLLASTLSAQTTYDPKVLPKGREYFELRDGLANCQLKFAREKTGRIAFLGGSITAGGGWRDHTIRYFQEKYPDTKFEFISAGIGSLGSVPHAFRLERDVLSKGSVDLLFVEAAVNDSSNIPDHPDQMLRGMEGVVRHARTVNPLTDIIHMHFVMPPHMDDYKKGNVPASIAQHEKVAVAYGNPTLNLALEVTDRIGAGEFSWDKDFKGLHPSPFGHQLYANSIARMLDAAFAQPPAAAVKPHPMPAPFDAKSYERGRFGNIAEARIINGFTLDPAWKPADGKGTRAGFVNVPALVGTEPGAEFEFGFDGAAAGLFITAGPDAGRIECSIDASDYRTIDTFTNWSTGLHLPWAVILDDNLQPGHHTAKVRIAAGHDAKGTGTALRVFHLLLN
jgi:lysophospholipase L1-like esterase